MNSRFAIIFLTLFCIFIPAVNADSNDLYLEILSPEDGFSFSDKLTVDFYVENRGNEKIVFSRQSYLALMIINDDIDGEHVVPWLTIYGNYEIDPGENWTLSVEWWTIESWYYNEVSISLGHYLDTEDATMSRTSNIPGEYGTSDLISGVHVPSSSQLSNFKKKETRIRLLKKEINLRTKVGPDTANPENSLFLVSVLEIEDVYWKRFPESYEVIFSAEKGTLNPGHGPGSCEYIAPDYETTDTITVSFPGTEKYTASSFTAKVNVLEDIFTDSWNVDYYKKIQSVEPHFMVNVSSPKPFTIYKIVLGGIVISEERFTVGGDFADQIVVNNIDEVFRNVRSSNPLLEFWIEDAYSNPGHYGTIMMNNNQTSYENDGWGTTWSTVHLIVDEHDDPIRDVWDFIIGVYTDLMNWIFG